jgi:chromosome partitioning protein
MITIGVISTKGGAGKSSTAINLVTTASATGLKTAIIDCDNQASVAEWGADRSGQEFPIIAQIAEGAVGAELKERLGDADGESVDLVVIDTAPRFIADIEAVIKASDLVLIVTPPRILDVRGIRPTIALVFEHAAEEKSWAVLTICPPRQGFTKNRTVLDAEALLSSDFQMRVCPISITRYEDVPAAITEGKGVVEYAPRSKAATEWQALWKWVRKQLDSQRRRAA